MLTADRPGSELSAISSAHLRHIMGGAFNNASAHPVTGFALSESTRQKTCVCLRNRVRGVSYWFSVNVLRGPNTCMPGKNDR